MTGLAAGMKIGTIGRMIGMIEYETTASGWICYVCGSFVPSGCTHVCPYCPEEDKGDEKTDSDLLKDILAELRAILEVLKDIRRDIR